MEKEIDREQEKWALEPSRGFLGSFNLSFFSPSSSRSPLFIISSSLLLPFLYILLFFLSFLVLLLLGVLMSVAVFFLALFSFHHHLLLHVSISIPSIFSPFTSPARKRIGRYLSSHGGRSTNERFYMVRSEEIEKIRERGYHCK